MARDLTPSTSLAIAKQTKVIEEARRTGTMALPIFIIVQRKTVTPAMTPKKKAHSAVCCSPLLSAILKKMRGGFNEWTQHDWVQVVPGGFTMAQMGHPGLPARQKEELWTRWKAGQSLSDTGRSLGKHAGSVFGVLLAKGGIAPPARIRSRVALSIQDREEISRGLVAGLSLRKIAEQLERSPSTISREVSWNHGRLLAKHHGALIKVVSSNRNGTRPDNPLILIFRTRSSPRVSAWRSHVAAYRNGRILNISSSES